MFGKRLSSLCKVSNPIYKNVLWFENIRILLGPNGELSGPVCGQDPRYCASPASVPPNEWSYDITRWPICKRQNSSSISGAPEHVTCKLTARYEWYFICTCSKKLIIWYLQTLLYWHPRQMRDSISRLLSVCQRALPPWGHSLFSGGLHGRRLWHA